MAKKRKFGRYARRAQGAVGQVKSFIRPVVSGVGGYAVAQTALNYLPIQLPTVITDIAPYGAAFWFGGWKGALGAFLLTGGLAKIGEITGGTSGFVQV